MASGQTTCRHLFEGQHVADLMGVGYSFSTLQQRTMKTIRKSGGWFGITALLGGLMLVAAFAAIFKLLFTSRPPQTTTQPQLPTLQQPFPTSTPISNTTNRFSELNGFPVYPSALFIDREWIPPCGQLTTGYADCDVFIYRWLTPDDFDKARSWYGKALRDSGWKCDGGAGTYTSPRDAHNGGSKCVKGSMSTPYTLTLWGHEESTEIQLETPNPTR